MVLYSAYNFTVIDEITSKYETTQQISTMLLLLSVI